jgi:hypothetical protein
MGIHDRLGQLAFNTGVKPMYYDDDDAYDMDDDPIALAWLDRVNAMPEAERVAYLDEMWTVLMCVRPPRAELN